jgi:tetratricopeptide (TPR) repeat protein
MSAARAALLFALVVFSPTLSSPDSNPEVTVESIRTTYKFENDGTGQVNVHAKWKAATLAGARRISEVSVPYVSEFEEVRVTSFRTLKKNGAALSGDSSQVFDRSPAAAQQAPVFSGTKLKQFVLPNVEAGDEIEYEYTKVINRSEKPGDFWAVHLPITAFPVESESVTLDIPADRKVSFQSNPAAQHTSTQQAGRRVEHWELKNPEAMPVTDVPEPVFVVSTFPSWDALGQWLRQLNNESQQVTPDIQQLAEKLTDGKTAAKDKVSAIYAYVSVKVRYVSISFGIGRLQPHKASDVLRNAYGDCKDKHALFAALLSAAGIKSAAVLTSPGVGVLAPAVPLPSQFVHEFTAVEAGDGEILLDTTLELADPEFLSPGVRGRQALLISTATAKIIDVPPHGPTPDRTAASVSGAISAEGKFSGTEKIECTGEAALLLRKIFREGAADQQQALLKVLSGIELLNATIKDVTHADPADVLHPFSLQYRTEQDNFMPAGETTKRITFYAGNPAETQKLLNMKAPRRSLPSSYREITRHVDLVIDPSFVITNRMPVHLHTKFGSYDSISSYDKGHLRIERSLKTSGVMVEPAEWTSYVQFFRALEAEEEQGFTIERHTQTAMVPRTAVSATPSAHDNLAGQYLAHAQPEKAIEEAKKQLETKPDDVFAYIAWITALEMQQKWEEAAEQAQKATALNPPNAYVWVLLGKAQAKMHKLDEMRASLNRALQIADTTIIQNDVAFDLADAGIDLDKAWQLASSALTVEITTLCNPDKLVEDAQCTNRFRRLANVLDTAGWVLVKEGKWREAEPYMTASYAISPRWPIALHLAQINSAMGNQDEALRLYATARQMTGFIDADATEIRSQLSKDLGGESSVNKRVAAVPRESLLAGLITSAPKDLPSGTFLVLVNGDGTIEDARTPSNSAAAAAQLASLKKLKLRPIAWPDHSLRSVRTVEIRPGQGGSQALSYIIRPLEE